MENTDHTIIAVDDEENVLKALKRCLRPLRIQVVTTTHPEAVLNSIADCDRVPAAVITDQRMPGMTGLELLRQVRIVSPTTTRILFTGYADMDVVIRAINVGEVYRFIRKPWEDAELHAALIGAIQHHQLLRDNERLIGKLREQKQSMEELEQEHPGLTRLPPLDETGAFILEPPVETIEGLW